MLVRRGRMQPWRSRRRQCRHSTTRLRVFAWFAIACRAFALEVAASVARRPATEAAFVSADAAVAAVAFASAVSATRRQYWLTRFWIPHSNSQSRMQRTSFHWAEPHAWREHLWRHRRMMTQQTMQRTVIDWNARRAIVSSFRIFEQRSAARARF